MTYRPPLATTDPNATSFTQSQGQSKTGVLNISSYRVTLNQGSLHYLNFTLLRWKDKTIPNHLMLMLSISIRMPILRDERMMRTVEDLSPKRRQLNLAQLKLATVVWTSVDQCSVGRRLCFLIQWSNSCQTSPLHHWSRECRYLDGSHLRKNWCKCAGKQK